MQDEQRECETQAVGGVVARAVVAGGDAREQPCQHREFAVENVCNHPPLGVDEDGIEVALLAAHVAPTPGEHGKSTVVEQEARDEVEPFVPCGAGDPGKTRQALPVAQDLFRHQVERSVLRPAFDLDQSMQPAEILMRVTQSIDVVEAQSMQTAFGDETADERVNRVEGAAVFDGKPGQRVDVEESPIINVAAGKPPMREAIVLALEQVMEGEDGVRLAASGAVGAQAAFDHVLAAGDRSELGFEGRRQGPRGIVRTAIALRPFQEPAAGGFLARARPRPGLLHNLAIAVWSDGQPMLEIPGGKAALRGIVAKLDFAALKRLAVGASEHWNQYAPTRMGGQRFPIDVE